MHKHGPYMLNIHFLDDLDTFYIDQKLSRSPGNFPDQTVSARLEDKLTLATEEGTKLVQQFILLWRSTKTDMRISMVK